MTREQLRRAAAAVKSGDPIRAAAFVPELLEEVESLRRSLAYDSANSINYLDQSEAAEQVIKEIAMVMHLGPPQSLEAWGKIQTLLLQWQNRR